MHKFLAAALLTIMVFALSAALKINESHVFGIVLGALVVSPAVLLGVAKLATPYLTRE